MIEHYFPLNEFDLFFKLQSLQFAEMRKIIFAKTDQEMNEVCRDIDYYDSEKKIMVLFNVLFDTNENQLKKLFDKIAKNVAAIEN